MEPLLISSWIKKFTCSAKKNAAKNNVLLKLLLVFVTISVNDSCNVQQSANAKVDVTGNWQVTISVAEGTILGKGSLSQSGEAVTGWVGPSEYDPIPITGIFKEGRLIIKTLPQPGRTVAFDKVELIVNLDTMSGAIVNGSHGKGTIKFIRSK
jgi:hypothetical protein